MSHHTFVTFLGRGRLTNDPEAIGYRKTTYQFPNGAEEKTSFFGVALAKQIKPNRVVILGTEGSQWSVLVEEGLAHTDENQAVRDELFESEITAKVTQTMLSDATKLMAQSFECEVVPLIIPFGRDESEQYKILDYIADKGNIPDGDVSLDLTHGFRHFGMIGFLSAFMLGRVRNLTVRDLWYGAFDMSQDEVTPVFTLDGLDRVRQWLDALNRFDATGDYRIFGSLLTKDGVDVNKAKHLENAAFHERTLNLSAAADEIRRFRPVLESKLAGASGLFQIKLLERLAWVDLDDLSKQQTKLARQYLKHRDYLRASLFGWEALVTVVCKKQGLDLKDPSIRTDQYQHIQAEVQRWPLRNGQKPGDNREACENLNQIRNALAHGSPPNSRRVQGLLMDEQQLHQTLQSAFDCLLSN